MSEMEDINMEKPVLVIMAAGMGSRYGGLKQIDPIDDQGQIIMDYSIYDAKKAGFEKVVFIIKKQNEEDFKAAIGNRVSRYMQVEYVFQDVQNIPDAYKVPNERVKPWGTGHAILSCMGVVQGPFAVINADDYYGSEAFEIIYSFLAEHQDDHKYRYTMVGYRLENTVTENGYVARGICEIDNSGKLLEINERTRIEKHNQGIAYTEDDGQVWVWLQPEQLVSMNMWGFSNSILSELSSRFPEFLEKEIPVNPLKCEYFLPSVVSDLLQEGKATVDVLQSKDKWYGVTYKEDKPVIVAAIQAMRTSGKYPMKLWD